MDRCEMIKAHMMMEERYEGVCLTYIDHPELKEEILEAVDAVRKEMGMSPLVVENTTADEKEGYQAIYVEFHDDIRREGGAFFTKLLKKLGIDHCERDV